MKLISSDSSCSLGHPLIGLSSLMSPDPLRIWYKSKPSWFRQRLLFTGTELCQLSIPTTLWTLDALFTDKNHGWQHCDLGQLRAVFNWMDGGWCCHGVSAVFTNKHQGCAAGPGLAVTTPVSSASSWSRHYRAPRRSPDAGGTRSSVYMEHGFSFRAHIRLEVYLFAGEKVTNCSKAGLPWSRRGFGLTDSGNSDPDHRLRVPCTNMAVVGEQSITAFSFLTTSVRQVCFSSSKV